MKEQVGCATRAAGCATVAGLHVLSARPLRSLNSDLGDKWLLSPDKNGNRFLNAPRLARLAAAPLACSQHCIAQLFSEAQVGTGV